MLHDFQKFSAIVVVHGENHGFELAIERFHFSAVVGGSIAGRGAPRLADRPAGDAFDMTLHPPAVENAQAWHAIQRGLHAAGAGGLQRKLWRVEPKVHAGSYFSTEIEIVVVKENHRHGFPQRFLRVENPAYDVLPAGIVRMRLAGINDLKGAGILGNLPETIKIS